jgi:hypothetical protein
MSVERIIENSTVTKIEEADIDLITGERSASQMYSIQDVQRFWDKQTESHVFVLKDTPAIVELVNNPSRYQSEGNEFDTPIEGTYGALPVYHYKNQTSQTNFYSFQRPEQITANYPVFQYEDIAFYAFPLGEQPYDSVPVHRFYNESTSAKTSSPVHFFTGSESNKEAVMRDFPTSFTYEGAGWYAYPETYNGISF